MTRHDGLCNEKYYTIIIILSVRCVGIMYRIKSYIPLEVIKQITVLFSRTYTIVPWSGTSRLGPKLNAYSVNKRKE